MLHSYSNLNFPICSLAISLLVLVIYFSKKNIKNSETSIYSKLVIVTVIEAFVTFALTLSVHLFFSNDTYLYFSLVNKFLYVIYIVWISLLFLYFVKISNDDNTQTKTMINVVIALNILLTILISIAPINLVYNLNDNVSNSFGIASVILYIGCAIYIFLMLIVAVINFKDSKVKHKYIPLLFLIILMTITMIIRVIDPYLNITSNVLSFIVLIMYFTIENPDLKMLKKVEIANMQMTKSNQIKSDFLSSMSHEIRTPLNAIIGFSSLAETADSLEEAQENSREVIEASNSLLSMVSNIIDMAKIESDSLEISKIKYNPVEKFSEVLNLFESKAKTRNIKYCYEFKNLPNYLFGELGLIRKIIVNTVDNAIKYTKKGEVNVSIKYIKKDNLLCIIVKDTGVGISKEKQEKLFKTFERLDNKNGTINGMGLGLVITKEIIDMLNGSLIINSKENSGTKVEINFKQELGD